MKILELLKNELEQESKVTRKMLALVPMDKLDWAPHEKSMKMGALSTHIAELPSWITLGLDTAELDFAAAPYEPKTVATSAQLLDIFEESFASGMNSLNGAKEEDLTGRWVLRTGEQIHADMSKYEIIRVSMSQVTHHRAQLGVYLRLLDIPIPGTYGPSADDMNF
ncbi:MAG: DinB family protein [Pedobacter sp.]|nr:DinB family protein [Pedobacter sp.]MDQ8052913.1 DinB family protein [Pedobacter sp.]